MATISPLKVNLIGCKNHKISLLKASLIGCKNHKFSSAQFSNNNLSFKLVTFNPKFPKLPILTTNWASKTHSIFITKPNCCTKEEEEEEEDIQFDVNKSIKSWRRGGCSFDKLFGDFVCNGGPMVETLSRNLASLLLYGLLVIIGLTLSSPNSVLAASSRCSSSRSSSSSLSRCSSSRTYDHYSCCCTCNCEKEGKKTSCCRTCNCDKQGGKKCTSKCCCTCNCEKEGKKDGCCFTCNCNNHHNNVDEIEVILFALWILGTFFLAKSALSNLGAAFSAKDEEGSVLMLQVGILDKKRILQRKINRIAKTADTSTPEGWNNALQEVLKALLQHYDSCHFAYLFEQCNDDSSTKKSIKRCYREISSRERGRFDKDEETFVNVDGVKLERAAAVHKANGVDNEYSVVTILVLARVKNSIPPSLKWYTEQVKSVLQIFCSIPSSKVETVELLWTPQREDETVSEQELLRDFPHMERVDQRVEIEIN